MNNDYNFKIPVYNADYGKDWNNFLDIIEENIDHSFEKTWSLYHLQDIDRMPNRVIEILLDVFGILYNADDSTQVKRLLLRNNIAKYINKGLASLYLEVGESITGLVGGLYNYKTIGYFEWDKSSWYGNAPDSDDIVWGNSGNLWYVYFDVKTTDSNKLDDIQRLLQETPMKPAFYTIYLIDSSWNILRTI